MEQPTKRSLFTTVMAVLTAGAGVVAILNFVTASRWQMSAQEAATDRYGGIELRDFHSPSAAACGQACVSDDQCQAYSFNVQANQCWLKADVPYRVVNESFVAAVKVAKPWWKVW